MVSVREKYLWSHITCWWASKHHNVKLHVFVPDWYYCLCVCVFDLQHVGRLWLVSSHGIGISLTVTIFAVMCKSVHSLFVLDEHLSDFHLKFVKAFFVIKCLPRFLYLNIVSCSY